MDVGEWRETPEDPKQGQELIPYPDLHGRSDETPSLAVNRADGDSPSRQDWLRRRVSNPRPGG